MYAFSCSLVLLINVCNSTIDVAEFAWVLSRTPEGITDSKMAELYGQLDNYGIKSRKFYVTRQGACPGRETRISTAAVVNSVNATATV